MPELFSFFYFDRFFFHSLVLALFKCSLIKPRMVVDSSLIYQNPIWQALGQVTDLLSIPALISSFPIIYLESSVCKTSF